MTIPEAAARVGISPDAVRQLVRAGALAHYRPTLGGRKIVLDAADVEAYWAGCRRSGSMPVRDLRWVRPEWDAKPFGRHR
jgi:excisionase family DNA binding protein